MDPPHSDVEFRPVSTAFDRDHDTQRGELLASVTRADHLRPKPHFSASQSSWLAHCVTAIAASLAIAAGPCFAFAQLDSRPALAFAGLHDRLLKIRSLHVTGWTNEKVVVDGQEKLEKFTFEYYAERPSRSWNTWIGFSPDGVRTGYHVIDGSRRLHVSHSDKLATLDKRSQLEAELRVESNLQSHWAQRLIGDAATDHKFVGKDEVNDVLALRYECIREENGGKTRTVVWLHPVTALPVRTFVYHHAGGQEQLWLVNDRIETNVPPRPDMFSFQVPEGYALNPANGLPGQPFVPASASGGGRQSAVRDMFAIDDRAVLICWMNQPRPDEPVKRPGAEQDTLKIKLELTGSPEKRPCRQFPLRTQQDQDQVWQWALVIPSDQRPFNLAEELSVVFKSRRSQMEFSGYPLHFDDERLAKLLVRLQTETFSEQSPDEGPFTLADLRRQLDRIAAQPIDENEPSDEP
jgi:outer membrane lipoprotein-sorting protein